MTKGSGIVSERVCAKVQGSMGMLERAYRWCGIG